MLRPLLLAALTLCLTGCVLQSDPALQSSGGATTTSAPRDFWIGITVTGPIRESSAAYDALPRPLRPARYVVEADRILRAALGPGAPRESFPPPPRRLSAAEFNDLFAAARDAGLLDPHHPFAVKTLAKPTTPDPAAPPNERTEYIITAHAADRQHTIIMEAAPHGSPESRKAAAVIDWLAGKAWVAPSVKP
ncbi:MAG TPA: hypothetical protein PKE29_13980 [Phycisphaerales bacterium]|nr:hypothetical protein [Phycisphaerales bacterium]